MAIVTVKKNRYTVDPLYQWDRDQVLEITGLSLPSIPEIHFTNDAMDKAIVRQATMTDAGIIRADIPNSLLQKPYKIKAYICVYEGETFESLYAFEIPIKARKKPSDYTIEGDEEIYSFNALENLVLNTLKKAEATLANEATAIAAANEAKRIAEEAKALAEAGGEDTVAREMASAAQNTASEAHDLACDAYGNAENIRDLALKRPNHTNYIGFVGSTEVAVENGDIVPAYNVTGLLDYGGIYYIAVDYAYSNGNAIVLYAPDGSYAISTDTCGVHLREYYDGEFTYLIWEDDSGNWCSFPRDDETCLNIYRIG